jgi:ABC-type lipoprotein release transport system permease subunit
MGPHQRHGPVTRRHLFTALLLALAAVSTSAQAPGVPTVLVSRQLAERRGLRVGDAVQLAAEARSEQMRTFRVAGIFEPTPDPMQLGRERLEVRLHLPDLLALTREPSVPAGTEYVDSVNILLADPADAAQFSRDFNARAPGAFAEPVRGPASSTFVVLEQFHAAIAAVTIIAATVFLLALTIMLVDERRETAGVLRLIGLPARRILAQVLLEGVLVAGLGALFGLALAFASEAPINRFFQWRYDTTLVFVRITPRVAAVSLAIAVPLGAAATVAASWALLRLHPTARKARGGGPGRGGLRLAQR